MENLFGSICLSDIPRELIRTSERNGKKYLSVVIARRRSGEDKYGYTHYIKVYAKRGEINENVNLYIGDLKVSQYQDANQQQNQPAQPAQPAQRGGDELPF